MYNKSLLLLAVILGLLSIYQAFEVLHDDKIVFVSILLFIIRLWFYSGISVKNNLSAIIIALYIDVGLILSPLFNYVTENIKFADMQHYESTVVIISALLLFLHIFITKFFHILLKKREDINFIWKCISKNRLNIYIYVWAFSYFTAIFLNDYLQIGILGQPSRPLPFQLGGVIMFYSSIVAPAIFFILLDSSYEKGLKKQLYWLIILIILFYGYDMVVRMSKGSFLSLLIPVTFWMIYRQIFSKKFIVIFSIPIILVIVLYQTIGELRVNNKGFDIVQIIDNVDIYNEEVILFTVNRLYHRVFLDSNMMKKTLNHSDSLSDNNFEEVSKEGGITKYHKQVIDGLSPNLVHSSGSSGFGGSFMIGGVPIAIFTLIIFSLMGVYNDTGNLGFISLTISGKVIFLIFLYSTMSGGFWNLMMKDIEILLVWPAVFLFHNYYARKYYKKYMQYQQ